MVLKRQKGGAVQHPQALSFPISCLYSPVNERFCLWHSMLELYKNYNYD